MTAFRYDTGGQWLKGNTHLHSTASDGGKSADELSVLYQGAGYDFLCLTDHWIVSREGSPQNGPLLLGGIELDGRDRYGSYYHAVCLGDLDGIYDGMDFEKALEAARAQGGFLILAHPHWTGNSLEEALRHNFHGVEIYNSVAQWMNGKCWGLYHWDAMLEHAPQTLGIAADDAHLRRENWAWNRGWIWVNVKERCQKAVLEALFKGNFFASTGPQICSLDLDGDCLKVRSSPVKHARIIGAGPQGKAVQAPGDGCMTEYEIKLPADYAYLRLEVEDGQGGRAWTNTLFATDN